MESDDLEECHASMRAAQVPSNARAQNMGYVLDEYPGDLGFHVKSSDASNLEAGPGQDAARSSTDRQ